jgi:hypothetical protein
VKFTTRIADLTTKIIDLCHRQANVFCQNHGFTILQPVLILTDKLIFALLRDRQCSFTSFHKKVFASLNVWQRLSFKELRMANRPGCTEQFSGRSSPRQEIKGLIQAPPAVSGEAMYD